MAMAPKKKVCPKCRFKDRNYYGSAYNPALETEYLMLEIADRYVCPRCGNRIKKWRLESVELFDDIDCVRRRIGKLEDKKVPYVKWNNANLPWYLQPVPIMGLLLLTLIGLAVGITALCGG